MLGRDDEVASEVEAALDDLAIFLKSPGGQF
jgi:hypothetical protein